MLRFEGLQIRLKYGYTVLGSYGAPCDESRHLGVYYFRLLTVDSADNAVGGTQRDRFAVSDTLEITGIADTLAGELGLAHSLRSQVFFYQTQKNCFHAHSGGPRCCRLIPCRCPI